jgi:adenylyltransferase/sulfurtransferase
VIELSNLHRQPLYNINDIGQAKVSIARKSLKKLNEKLTVIAEDRYLDESNGQELLKDADVIIDATDNIKTRQVIDHISKTARIPMVYGGLYRFEGQVAVLNHNGGPGYEDIFTPDPAGGDTCAEAGVLGMLPAIIGNIQALEAVKIIIGIKPNLSGKLLLYDGITHETNTINVGANT